MLSLRCGFGQAAYCERVGSRRYPWQMWEYFHAMQEGLITSVER